MGKARLPLFKSPFAQFGVAFILAAMVFSGFWILSPYGDCRPHEVDGQCGMSTVFGRVAGAVVAGIILFGRAIAIAIRQSTDRDGD